MAILIDYDEDVGDCSSIAVYANKIHVCDYDVSNYNLKYAFSDGSGNWNIKTIDSTGNVGTDTSICLDLLGRVHISYYILKSNVFLTIVASFDVLLTQEVSSSI